MSRFLLFVTSAILHLTGAAGKEKMGREEHWEMKTRASGSRSPYSTEDVVQARESGRFKLDFVMKAAAEGSGGVIEDWIRAGGTVDDRDAKARNTLLMVASCVNTYVPVPPYCTYGLHVPPPCVLYVP